jgi:hypothetical protein
VQLIGHLLRTSALRRFSLAFYIELLLAHVAFAGGWPPPDPGKLVTTVAFTVKWAKHLRGFHTLADVQREAGSMGTITERDLNGPDPTVAYHWRSEPQSGDLGYMVATVRPDGRIGVSILTGDNIEIVLNNEGGFICDKCKPPIDVQ